MSATVRQVVLPALICLELVFLTGFGLGFIGEASKMPYDPRQALNGAGLVAVLLVFAFRWRTATIVTDHRAARAFVESEMATIIERLHAAGYLPLRGSERSQLAVVVDSRLDEWEQAGLTDRNQRLLRQGVVIHPDDATFTGRLTDYSWSRAHGHETTLLTRALLCGEVLGYLTACGCYQDDTYSVLSGRYVGERYQERHLERFQVGLPAEGLVNVPLPS